MHMPKLFPEKKMSAFLLAFAPACWGVFLILTALSFFLFSDDDEAKKYVDYEVDVVSLNIQPPIVQQVAKIESVITAVPKSDAVHERLNSVLSAYDQLEADWLRFSNRASRYDRALYPERLQARYEYLKMHEASLSKALYQLIYEASQDVIVSAQCAPYFEKPRFSWFSKVFASETVQHAYSFAAQDKICYLALQNYEMLNAKQVEDLRVEQAFFNAIPYFQAGISPVESTADPRIAHKEFLELYK